MKEKVLAPFINHFVLAEKCYETEIAFIRRYNYSIIENKYYPFEKKENSIQKNNKIRLLFSGTIAKETGVFEAIDLVRKLHKIDNEIYLVIAGSCASKSTLQKLKNISKSRSYIKLIGGSSPLHHEDILVEIKKSHFGIISYPITKVTRDRIPTKLYEYLANHLPVIANYNENWHEIIEKYNGGISISFENFDAEKVYQNITQQTFFNNSISNSELLWENEEPKLLKVVEEVK